MMTAEDPFSVYQQLVIRVDGFFDRIRERFPTLMRCAGGCEDCCHRDLSLFSFEVEELVKAAKGLSPEQIARIHKRAILASQCASAPCPLLEDGHCLVYESRPIICRTHGLPMLVPGEASISICPYNFRESLKIEGDCVLDLSPVNQILATVNHLLAQERSASPDRVAVSQALLVALGPNAT